MIVKITQTRVNVNPRIGMPTAHTVASKEVVRVVKVQGGRQGLPGYGIPAGGQSGYRLVKRSNSDFDVHWVPQVSGPDKSVQFVDGVVLGNDPNFRWDKNEKALILGQPNLLTNNQLAIGGSLDDFLQVNINNTSEGAAASADYVATNDAGSDSNHYIDMGINSSVYDQPDFSATKAHDGYLLVSDGDLVIGPITPGHRTVLIAGGATEDAILGHITEDGIDLLPGFQFMIDGTDILDSRPIILYGTGDAPDPSDLPDGTIFIKYNP